MDKDVLGVCMARSAAWVVALAIWMVAAAVPASAALITPTNDANTVASAIESQDGLVTGASFASGPSSATASGSGGLIGNFFPTDGPTFAVLTTGDVANADPPNDSGNKGANNGVSSRGVRDLTILKVDVNVPADANCIGFDAVFYSEEFNEFIGSSYNDGFLAELDRNDWTYADNTVTAPGNFAFDTNGKQLTVNSALVSTNETNLQYDGSTVLLRARTQVAAGAHSIYFTIFDAGDNIYDSAVFLDNLRAASLPADQCIAGAAPADTDGDGLRDDWEDNGLDSDSDGDIDVDLPKMGADSQHKDIFVEMDSMRKHKLSDAALGTIVTSFANSPVTNPDGTTGIRLHIDNGPNSTMNPVNGDTWGKLSRAKTIRHQNVLGTNDAGGDYDWTAFDTIKSANFVDARLPIFHYGLSVHFFGNATDQFSGVARGIPSSDFIVALGRNNAAGVDVTLGNNFQSGTFMHELGHTLGLFHGGNENVNYKPNYLSVMNYIFQFPGLSRSDTAATSYDYSRHGSTSAAGTVADLDESSLSEDSGLTASGDAANFKTAHFCNGDVPGSRPQPLFDMNGPVDWDCDGAASGTVSTSINQGSDKTTLTPFDDWPNIRYAGGAISGLGRAQALPTKTALTDDISSQRLQKIASVMLGDSVRPKVRIIRSRRGRKGARNLRLRIVASDNEAIDNILILIGRERQIVQAATKKALKRRRVLRARITLRRGQRKVRAIATDRAGNTSRMARLRR